MAKVEFVSNMQNEILKNENEMKSAIQNQIQRFKKLLVERIVSKYNYFDKETLNELFDLVFKPGLVVEIDEILKNYKEKELDFYSGHFKTVDLIFNTLDNKRTQTIYLENVMKKINENKIEITNDIFSIPRMEGKTSIDSIYSKFVQNIIKRPNIAIDEVDDLYMLLTEYYRKYKNDFLISINNFIENNWRFSITMIETEMDLKELRNGKTSAVSKLEKTITNNAIKMMDEFLLKTLVKYNAISKKQLEICSKKVVDLIFEQLPIEYQDQRGLLEVIVDTNIQERLGYYLEGECEKVSQNIKEQNKDKISNELYDEKRYKNIENYDTKLNEIVDIYSNVLHEIAIAYDIPENELTYEKMLGSIKKEAASTKIVFKKLFDFVRYSNETNLVLVINDMHNLSKKAVNGNLTEDSMKKR